MQTLTVINGNHDVVAHLSLANLHKVKTKSILFTKYSYLMHTLAAVIHYLINSHPHNLLKLLQLKRQMEQCFLACRPNTTKWQIFIDTIIHGKRLETQRDNNLSTHQHAPLIQESFNDGTFQGPVHSQMPHRNLDPSSASSSSGSVDVSIMSNLEPMSSWTPGRIYHIRDVEKSIACGIVRRRGPQVIYPADPGSFQEIVVKGSMLFDHATWLYDMENIELPSDGFEYKSALEDEGCSLEEAIEELGGYMPPQPSDLSYPEKQGSVPLCHPVFYGACFGCCRDSDNTGSCCCLRCAPFSWLLAKNPYLRWGSRLISSLVGLYVLYSTFLVLSMLPLVTCTWTSQTCFRITKIQLDSLCSESPVAQLEVALNYPSYVPVTMGPIDIDFVVADGTKLGSTFVTPTFTIGKETSNILRKGRGVLRVSGVTNLTSAESMVHVVDKLIQDREVMFDSAFTGQFTVSAFTWTPITVKLSYAVQASCVGEVSQKTDNINYMCGLGSPENQYDRPFRPVVGFDVKDPVIDNVGVTSPKADTLAFQVQVQVDAGALPIDLTLPPLELEMFTPKERLVGNPRKQRFGNKDTSIVTIRYLTSTIFP